MTTEKVHISRIRIGDAIIHNGKERTVTGEFIKRDSFMGISIFGDTYHFGYKLVERVIYKTNKN